MASSTLVSPIALPIALPRTRRDPPPWLMVMPVGIALALLPPFLSISMLVAVAGLGAVLVRPRWALYLLALTVPYQSMVGIKLFDISVSVTEGVVGLLVVALMTHLVSRRVRPGSSSPLVAALLMLLVCFALTIFVASSLNLAVKEMLKWIELTVVFMAGTSLLETAAHRRMLLAWLLGAAASQAVVGLLQSVMRRGPESFLIGGVIMRAYGTFEQPNPFAGYLGLTVPLAVSLALFGLPPGRWRKATLVVAGLTGVALLITLSRGAWVAQVFALLLVLLANSRRARRAVITGAVVIGVLLAPLWPLLPAEITERASSVVASAINLGAAKDAVVTPENWAVMERLSQWYAGWQMLLDRPLLGVGIGNYNAAYDDYRLEQWPVALGHAHNHYLTVAAEAGLLGFLAYVGFWMVAFRFGTLTARRARGKLERATAVGILASLLAFATHNLFDVMFVHGMGVTLGLLLTLLHGIPFGLTTESGSASVASSASAPSSATLPGAGTPYGAANGTVITNHGTQNIN